MALVCPIILLTISSALKRAQDAYIEEQRELARARLPPGAPLPEYLKDPPKKPEPPKPYVGIGRRIRGRKEVCLRLEMEALKEERQEMGGAEEEEEY